MTELSPADDATLRRYLLGDLAPEAREPLEERLLTDGDFYDLLLIAEDDLLDEYVLGVLSPEDKGKFESHFLSTPERRQKLRFAGALTSYVTSASDSQPAEERRSWFAFGLLASDPRVGLGVAAALLLMLVSGAWWSSARIGRLQEEVDALTSGLESTRVETVRSTKRAPPVVSFLLVPGMLRGSGETTRVVVPTDTSLVELQLELGAIEHENYRAVLQDADGDEIWMQGKVRAGAFGPREVVRLTLPSTLLDPGDYVVKLAGTPRRGPPRAAGSYYFRVVSN